MYWLLWGRKLKYTMLCSESCNVLVQYTFTGPPAHGWGSPDTSHCQGRSLRCGQISQLVRNLRNHETLEMKFSPHEDVFRDNEEAIKKFVVFKYNCNCSNVMVKKKLA